MNLRPAVAALLLAFPAVASAQGSQCRLPSALDRPSPAGPVRPDGPSRRTPIDRYILALSWSPQYCRGSAGRRADNRYQCSGSIGRFGFVLHGLWPEAPRGAAPQWCPTALRPSSELVRQNLCMTPMPWMFDHEWAKHGSCITGTPDAYFRTARILYDAQRFPDMQRLSREPNLNAGSLRTALIRANPALKRDGIDLLLTRDGWLREVHLCYSRRFLPAACPAHQLQPRDTVRVKIWGGN